MISLLLLPFGQYLPSGSGGVGEGELLRLQLRLRTRMRSSWHCKGEPVETVMKLETLRYFRAAMIESLDKLQTAESFLQVIG